MLNKTINFFKDRFPKKTDFKWIKHSEFVQLYKIDVSEDPVRPELDLQFRTNYDREIYGLKFNDDILGVICIAYTNDIPCSVKELDLMSQLTHLKTFLPSGMSIGRSQTELEFFDQDKERVAIAYTVWSKKKGAGKLIMQKALKHMQDNSGIDRLVTLSPLTAAATHYHIRNGAKLISINSISQNFEYELK